MKRPVAHALVAGLASAVLLVSARGGQSAYTKFDLDACTTLSRDAESGGISLQCTGYGGVPVYASEGDLRFDVDYGAPDGRWDSFGPFNHPHTTIEWRLADGAPFAAIHRFFLDSGEGTPDSKRQVLKVSRVGNTAQPGCPIAYVDASNQKDANLLARGAADMAPAIDCASDKAVIVGDKAGLLGLGIMSVSR